MLIDFTHDPSHPSGGWFLCRQAADGRAIQRWVGWRRYPKGVYKAPAWASSLLQVKPVGGDPLQWTSAAVAERDLLQRSMNIARKALEAKLTFANPVTKRLPKLHQAQGTVALTHMQGRALLADDMGLGKTSTVLWALHALSVKRVLVVCPVSVKFNWQREIHETIFYTSIVVNGSAKKRADQLSTLHAVAREEPVIGIINYDLLRHLTDAQLSGLKDFVNHGSIVFDESHYLKNRGSARSKLAVELAKRARHVICCTGTPIRNLADDLFQQIQLIQPGTWTSYHDFARRYLVIRPVTFGKREVQKICGTKNVDELNAVVNTVQIARKKEDVLDLPAKTYTHPILELEGDLLKVYEAMKEHAKILLSELAKAEKVGLITIWDPRAKTAVEAAMRCEQLAQGFIGGIPDPVMTKISGRLKGAERISGRPNELIFPAAPKLVWLLETIESVVKQGGAPVVFTRFNAPMAWLTEELSSRGMRPLCLHGGINAEDRNETLIAFARHESEVLICQVKIAEGWNATRSEDCLFLGRDWSPAINAQAEDRLHRIGQKGTVNVQIPLVRNTIEQMLDRRLRAKDADAQQALRTLTLEELSDAL